MRNRDPRCASKFLIFKGKMLFCLMARALRDPRNRDLLTQILQIPLLWVKNPRCPA